MCAGVLLPLFGVPAVALPEVGLAGPVPPGTTAAAEEPFIVDVIDGGIPLCASVVMPWAPVSAV